MTNRLRLAIVFLSAIFLLLPLAAEAQNSTIVTGTITDVNGLPYSGARVQAQLIPAGVTPRIPPPCNGQSASPCFPSGFSSATADVTGSFSMNLASNAVLIPGGTQWQFTINETGIAPPGGTGAQTCNATLTISGASQSVSSSFSACPALGRAAGASSGSGPPAGVCTASQLYVDITTGALYTCKGGVWVLFSASTFGPNALAATTFGVKADGQFCFGLNSTITNLSTTVQCFSGTGASFGSVTANVATLLTDATSPLRLGWNIGDTVVVAGYTGADTFFNGTFVLTAVTDSSISYALVHANANSTTFGNIANQTAPGPFSAVTDPGKDIFSTNGCCGTGASIGSVVILPLGQIQSVTDSHTVVTNVAATNTSSGTAWLVFGTNDDAAWTLVDNAAAKLNACPTIFGPSGISLIRQPHILNIVSPVCGGQGAIGRNIGTTLDNSAAFIGYTPGSSIFVWEPGFNFSACIYGGGSNGCHFGGGVSKVIMNVGFTGAGNSLTGSTTNNVMLNFAQGDQMFYVNGLAFGASDTALVGAQFNFAHITGGFFDMLGAVACKFTGGNFSTMSWWFCGDTTGTNLLVTAGSALYSSLGSTGNVYGNSPAIDINGANARWYSTQDTNYGGTINSQSYIIVRNGATADITQGNFTQSCTSCNTLASFTGNNKVHLRGTTINGSGTTANALSFDATSLLFDDCGNIITGTTRFSGAGPVFGNCSITGTAFTTASFALTSGWGASTKASATGDSQSFNFVITGAAGAAGPVVTVTFPTPYLVAPSQCTINQTSGTFAVLTNPAIGALTATGFTITWAGTPAANTYGFSGTCR